jgi:hypothetical protein
MAGGASWLLVPAAIAWNGGLIWLLLESGAYLFSPESSWQNTVGGCVFVAVAGLIGLLILRAAVLSFFGRTCVGMHGDEGHHFVGIAGHGRMHRFAWSDVTRVWKEGVNEEGLWQIRMSIGNRRRKLGLTVHDPARREFLFRSLLAMLRRRDGLPLVSNEMVVDGLCPKCGHTIETVLVSVENETAFCKNCHELLGYHDH